MTEGIPPEGELTGEAQASPKPNRKWAETPAGRAAAGMVAIGLLGIVAAVLLLVDRRAFEVERATEATDPAPPAATETATPTATATATATPAPNVPTITPTTSAPPASPLPPRPPAVPAVTPGFTPAPAVPTTVPTTAATPTAEESAPEMPELNVTRGPIEMSPHRGDSPEEE